MKFVYVTLMELRPLAGCKIDPDEYNGVCVRCYISARTESDARDLLMQTLAEERFEWMNEEFFVRDDQVEWENPDSIQAADCVREAIDADGVVFSEFHGWGHDDPHAWPSRPEIKK